MGQREYRMTPEKGEAFAMFMAGAPVEEVAKRTGRSKSTCWEYLAQYVETEKPASIETWVSPELYQKVAAAYQKIGWGRLKILFDELHGTVPFDVLRVIAAHVRGVAKPKTNVTVK